MATRQQLEQAIAAQETLRGSLDDAIIDAAIAALQAQIDALEPSPAGSRRSMATLLFMDLVDHTDLVRGWDPEEIMETIDTALREMSAPVGEYGGRIARYQGDGFKAVFGLPVAREQDPDNAILAGLAIQETAARIAARPREAGGLPGLQARVGIATGLVLSGGSGTEGEDAVAGMPVNLAARLEKAAAPGTVLIAHDTYRLVRGVFDFQPLDAVMAKGFAEPVPVYRVLRRKPRSFRTRRRGVEGVETRMIGRDAQLAALQDMYHQMMERRECLSAVIVGEAGLGKSRLLYEFENWGDLQPANVRLFRGRAWLETQGQPYGLMRDLFAFRCGIHDDDSTAAVRAKLVAGFRSALGDDDAAERKAHLVGHLLGYDFAGSPYLAPLLSDARQLRAQALFHMTEYFSTAARDFPMLILLEDLHWADDSSLDAIEARAMVLKGHAVLFLAAARPPLFERRPDWMAGHPAHTRIDLTLLDPEASGLLVAEILQRAERVPPHLRSLVIERAEGNPFYVEELIKMLIEEGVIVKGEEAWRVEESKLAGLNMPPTLTGILQARLDALPAVERDVLQMASVIGRLFWDAAVDYISRQHAGNIAEDLWQKLRGRELIYLREDVPAFEDTMEYIFKHAILRDVIYESVLKRMRREYHHHAAEWLSKAAGERADEYADQIAAHYAAAGDASREGYWQGRAGRQAARQYAAPQAIRALTRALELTPNDDLAGRYELLEQRQKIYNQVGERGKQAADLADMGQLAAALGDARRLAEVSVERTRYHLATGEYETALTVGQEALRMAGDAGEDILRAQAMVYCGSSLMFLGDYDAARLKLESARHLAGELGDKYIQMDSMRNLGIMSEELGDFESQYSYFEQALALARESSDRIGERRTLNSLGVAALNRGLYEQAQAYYRESLAIARETGDRMGQGTVLGNMGIVASNLGHYEDADRLFEEALQLARDINDRTGVNISQLNLAGVRAYMGDYDSALALYQESLVGTRETSDRPLLGYILNGIGRALLLSGRLDEAAAALREAMDLRIELGQHHTATETRAYLSEALARAGDRAAALADAEQVLAFLVDGEFEDVEDELRVLQSLHFVLDQAGDGRAGEVVTRAHARIMAAAGQLDEASRRSYMQNVPWNRFFLDLWARRSGG